MRLITINNSLAKMKPVSLIVVTSLLFVNCKQQNAQLIKLAGNAQGTTWQVTWLSNDHADYKEAIDSIFRKIDSSLSTYLPASLISRINQNETSVIVDDHFIHVFNKSIEVSQKTNGAFDITVAPVINAWGFGFTKKANVDSVMIDSLLGFIGYQMLRLEGKKLIKAKPQLKLDCNAIAQGYTVDLLASFLESKGISNYLVEVGGEVKAKGKKNTNDYWTVGIDEPNEAPVDGRPLKAIIKLKDRALATSGNYRKFYVEDGKKYAHIIDPHTGYPAKHNLLSATVVATDCATADAYATAFMAMGMEKAKQFLAAHKELQLEVFFIYDEDNVWKTYSSGTLKKAIEGIP